MQSSAYTGPASSPLPLWREMHCSTHLTTYWTYFWGCSLQRPSVGKPSIQTARGYILRQNHEDKVAKEGRQLYLFILDQRHLLRAERKQLLLILQESPASCAWAHTRLQPCILKGEGEQQLISCKCNVLLFFRGDVENYHNPRCLQEERETVVTLHRMRRLSA